MAEKIILAQLDIDTDKLIGRQVELLKAISELKKEMASLTEETKKNGGANDEQSKKIEKTKNDIAALNKEYAANKRALVDATAQENAYQAALDRENTTVAEARRNNAELVKIRNNTTTATEEGVKKIAELNRKINENNDFIKNNVSALEQQKIGIGGYSDGIIKAAEALGIEGRSLTLVQTLVVKLKGAEEARAAAQDAATTATSKSVKTLNTFKVALASTGIGLLVVALGSLVAYFQSTEEGGNKLNKVMARIGNLVNQLKEPLVAVGELLVDAFENPKEAIANLGELIKQNLINRITGTMGVLQNASKALKLLFEGKWSEAWEAAKDTAWSAQQAITGVTEEGWEKAGEAVDKFGNRLAETDRKTQELSDREAELTKQQRAWAIERANMEDRIVDLKRTSQDQTKSLEERERAAAEALRLQEQIRQRDVALAQEAYDIQKERNGLASSNAADLDKEAELLANLNRVSRESGERMIELNNQLNTIRKEGAAQDEAARQKEKQDRVKMAEDNLRRYEADQEQRRLGLEDQKRNFAEELAYTKGLYELKGEIVQESYDNGLIAKEEYDMQMKELNNEYIAELQRIGQAEKERQEEEEQEAFEEQLMKAEDEFERRQMELDRWRAQELANTELTESQKDEIKNKYAAAEKQIERDKTNYKLDLASKALSGVASALGEETVMGKAAAVAEATISTYLAASKALETYPVPMGAIMAAIAVAQGLSNVQKIVGIQLPKFEDGGSFIVGGKRHSAGGTKFFGTDGSAFEAEAGERITIQSRAATNLSASNVRIGGRPVLSMRPAGYGSNAANISKTIENLTQTPIVVTVTDIVDGVDKRTEVVDESEVA